MPAFSTDLLTDAPKFLFFIISFMLEELMGRSANNTFFSGEIPASK